MKFIKVTTLILSVAIIVAILSYQKIISNILLPQYIDWAFETDNKGLESGVALNAQELSLATDIGIQNPEKVRIVYVDEIPFPYENFALKTLGEALGFIGEGITNNAQVFGYSIYVRNGYELNRPKLAHELVHVLQIERTSLDHIITKHFSDLAEYGYDKAPLEVEAFKANKDYAADWRL
ncbi:MULTISPECIES: hypothetical protein [unclassified Arsukibacterium]|uniref:hypothetical protein n=1 Tax=unclassified Arsukibacterium TaxID=2635278 RepID=UPI000C4CB5DB|nr:MULTISPECIES: hypothetical protein [unclassified Arsukibacterium]MAA96327.1 hypothetical protein [Rheinheimera sp.]MBM33807.1 hypothetical protein [Rheinheimera sp.]HAW93211.1 hypothetical protein [Candidatus Azambacteria bacterium]|tara:strand:- start:4682 stop:5221 length:540 start_codon:yes stop_codon:yes gene_type:complete